MQKVDGVQTVHVNLNEGLTIVDLKPGNAVTLAKLRQTIKNTGFVSKEAGLVARGSTNGQREFIVSGTNEHLLLAVPPKQVAEHWRLMVPAPKP